MRVLRNLHGVYVDAADWERAVRCADRILKLSPEDPDALRDRGMGYLELGHRHGARRDLGLYLQRKSRAADAASVRESLIELGADSARPN
jgi:regulator of sirC expression with transglutaminase-like and TPR domain